jgi:hypothetical protein
LQDAPPTPVGQFRAWVDAFERLGYDADRLLAEIGVARSDFPDPDRLIPCAVVALFQRAQQIRRLKNQWARLAAVTPLGALPLLDYLILTSDTVGNGVEQAARYFRLVGAPFELDIRSEEDPVRVVYLITGPAPPCTVEYSAILCLQGFRSETDGRMRFAYVSLTCEPDDISEIEELLGCEVRAKASWSGWAVPHDIWDLPQAKRTWSSWPAIWRCRRVPFNAGWRRKGCRTTSRSIVCVARRLRRASPTPRSPSQTWPISPGTPSRRPFIAPSGGGPV